MKAQKNKTKKQQQQLIDKQLDQTFLKESNTSSTTECTGLMYRPPFSEYEEESYDEIYHFLPPSDTFS